MLVLGDGHLAARSLFAFGVGGKTRIAKKVVFQNTAWDRLFSGG